MEAELCDKFAYKFAVLKLLVSRWLSPLVYTHLPLQETSYKSRCMASSVGQKHVC